MALRTLDAAHETSETTGVNDYVLEGRANPDDMQFKESAVEDGYTIGNGNDLFRYVVRDGAQVEMGRGYIVDNGGPGSDVLTRQTIEWTFNGTTYDATSPAKISWSTGLRDVLSTHRGSDVVDAANDGAEFDAAAFAATLDLARLTDANTWAGFQTAHTDYPSSNRHFATKKYFDAFFPSGVDVAFYQAAVPSAGWTRNNSWNDRVAMVASAAGLGDGAQTGGSWQQDGHTLTTDELADHDHNVRMQTVAVASGAGETVVQDLVISGTLAQTRGIKDYAGPSAHDHGSTWRPAYVTVVIGNRKATPA